MRQPATELAKLFLTAVPEPWRGKFAEYEALDADLQALWKAAATCWPGLQPQPAVFARLLARLIDGPTPALIAELPGSQQYLVAACLAHQDQALRTFEREYFDAIDHGLARMNLDSDTHGEVVQKVREKLYVARADGSVPLEEYAGKGSMRSFLRVMATRVALNLLRSRKVRDRLPERHKELLPDAVAAPTPELRLLKETHRVAFKQALADAVAELTAEERNLLRLHLVDGLTIDEMAELHHTHRATAARRIARVRTKIAERTRAILNTRLELTTGEFTSVIQLVQSQLDMSMRQILKSRSKEGSSKT